MVQIIVGAALIVFQILSYIGNLAGGGLDFFKTFSVNEVIYFVSFNLVGVAGLIVLLLGVRSIRKKK